MMRRSVQERDEGLVDRLVRAVLVRRARLLGRAGQSSVEYVFIIGFVMLMFVPIVYLLFTSVREYQDDAAISQSFAAGREILATAERVYHHGPPSRLTVPLRMPAGLSNLTIYRITAANPTCVKCTELRFVLQNGREATASTAVDVRAVCDTINGKPWAEALPDGTPYDRCPLPATFFREGERRFVLEVFTETAENDYVTITLPES